MKLSGSDLSRIVMALRFTRETHERRLVTIDEDHDDWPDLQEDIQGLKDTEQKVVQLYRAEHGDAVSL